MKSSQKVFQILDLDRTLLDTPKLAHHLKEVIARHDKSFAHDIDMEIAKHIKEKSAFYIFEFIVNRVGNDKLHDFIEELHRVAPVKELLLPGAKERIAFAKSQPGWAMGIMTYGSKRDQMIKLKLVGLQLEHLLIVNNPYKAQLIAGWQRSDGKFKLPIDFGGHVVDIVTLDDDRYIAFENLPSGAYGQWVTKATLGGTTELQKISDNIRVVPDLYASVQYLKSKLTSN